MRRLRRFLLGCAAGLAVLAAPADAGGVRNLLLGAAIPNDPTANVPVVSQTALATFNFTASWTNGPVVGDILVAYGFQHNCSGSAAPPTVNTGAGWISIANHTGGGGTTPGAAFAYKIAGSSESATQTPFTGVSSPLPFGVMIVDLTNPGGSAYSAYAVTTNLVDGSLSGPPINATPSVTPTASTSLVLAFGGWISCGVGAGATALSISGGGTFTGTQTSFLTGASNDVSMLYAQQSVSGTSAISPTIAWTANNAPGLDGAEIVFNHP